MKYVSGKLFTENGFEKGFISFNEKKIIEKGNKLSVKEKPIAKGLIIPLTINSHTHIGDSFIKNKKIKLPRDINKLVAPPDGLKHRLLKETSNKKIIQGMKSSIDLMLKNGTKIFCDFRENGLLGLNLIKSSLRNQNIKPIILSRPKNLHYNKKEIELLLKNSQGIGISSITDWDYSELKKISIHTIKEKKIFSIHASERIREDIDLILDLKPNFLIHMTKANRSDLIRVKENGIAIVLCPRSNNFFGLKPKIHLMKKIGLDLILGTDNAMINYPNILDELKFLKKNYSDLSMEELLNMLTYKPRKVLNLRPFILGPNSPADFIVLDKKNLSTLYISLSK